MSTNTQFTDASGISHAPVSSLEITRIVSLVPSITELLCDLDLSNHLVGRTGFCIHPDTIVRQIPKVGGTKDVNIAKVKALAPTHLIVNVDENEKAAVEELASFIPHVIVTHPIVPQDNLALYRLLGHVFQRDALADQLYCRFEQALANFPPVTSTTKVLYCIWQDPWMSIHRDTYIANMLALKGWTQWVAPDTSLRYPDFAWNPSLLNEIDVVFLSTEPYRFTEQHVDALEQQLGKPVYLLDGEMLSWYGSRAITALDYLRHFQL
jgi:ABC-type Fe3+-hydroxamate transport system substrate-binding protein